MKRRVAIYGGSFDPPHLGHVFVTAWALSAHSIDEIWVFPVFKHRFGKQLTGFDARLELCKAAFSIFGDRVRVRDDERLLCRQGGSGATVELVEHLRRVDEQQCSSANTDLRLLVGSDQLDALDRWHRCDDLRRLAPLLVIARAGYVQQDGQQAVVIPNINSTEIRERLAAGDVAAELVPAAVAALLSKGLSHDDG